MQGVLASFFWPMFVAIAVLVGVLLGLIHRALGCLIFGFILVLNVAGLLGDVIFLLCPSWVNPVYRASFRESLIALVVALAAAAVVYELVFTLAIWLYLKGESRVLHSVLKRYIADNASSAGPREA